MLVDWGGGQTTSNDARTVIVDQEMLRTCLQYRANIFDSARADEMLAELSEDEFDRLVPDLVREEVLQTVACDVFQSEFCV